MPSYFKVVHSVHFYISVRRLLYQLNARSELIQTLKKHLQHVSVHVYHLQVPKHFGDIHLMSALIKTVHGVGVINGVR
jgi:lactam utilization protein B